MRIEREDRGLIEFAIHAAQQMRRGFARLVVTRFHAAADVDEQRQTHTRTIELKVGDPLRLTAVENFKIAHAQVLDKTSLAITNDRAHADEIHRASKHWRRRRLRVLIRSEIRTPAKGENRQA